MASINQSGALTALPDWAAAWLSDVLDRLGISSCNVSETTRTSDRQALIMFNMAQRKGLPYTRRLYGRPGNMVLDVYETMAAPGMTPPGMRQVDFVVPAMTAKIDEVGGSNVSHHIPKGDLCVFDIGPASLGGSPPTEGTMATGAQALLLAELRAHEKAGYIKLLIPPPKDPAYHIEITPDGAAKYAIDKASGDLATADPGDTGPGTDDAPSEGDTLTDTEGTVAVGGGVLVALAAALGGLYWWRNRGSLIPLRLPFLRKNPRSNHVAKGASRALRLRRGRR